MIGNDELFKLIQELKELRESLPISEAIARHDLKIQIACLEKLIKFNGLAEWLKDIESKKIKSQIHQEICSAEPNVLNQRIDNIIMTLREKRIFSDNDIMKIYND